MRAIRSRPAHGSAGLRLDESIACKTSLIFATRDEQGALMRRLNVLAGEARRFESHVEDTQPLATPDVESRIAGELWFAVGRPDGPRHEHPEADFGCSDNCLHI